MTDSDRTVRILCSFDAIDQTVTLMSPNSDKPGIDVHKKSYLYSGNDYGSDIKTGGPLVSSARSAPITSVVTNTAPPPSVIMRILDKTGKDAQVVGLGDELTLQIELRDASSAFGLFARNLYARSSNGESLFLLDNTGCPTDPLIFPALQLDDKGSRALNGVFKAFRFPSSGIVNFEVQVRFCQDKCEPVKCSGVSTNHGDSYGRRKRSTSIREMLDLKSDDMEEIEGSESQSEEVTFVGVSSTTTENSLTDSITMNSAIHSTTDATTTMMYDNDLIVSKSPLMEDTPSADKFVMNDTASSITPPALSSQHPHQQQTHHQSRSLDGQYHGYQGHHNPYSYPQDYMSSASSGYPPPSSTGHNYYGNHVPQFHSSSSHLTNYNPYMQQSQTLFNHYSPQGGQSSASNINPWIRPPSNQPFVPSSSSPFNNNDSGNKVHANNHDQNSSPLSKFSYSPPNGETASTTTPSSRNMFVHSSRPLPSSEKGKFRPPRPLPRPKTPTTSGSSVVGTDTLRTTIMVGDGPDKELNENGESIDRSWSPSKSAIKGGNCNTGPAILYTALIVTLLHIGIVLGGYFYYRRFGYSSSRIKLFSTPSFSREETARDSFGGPSFSPHHHLHHNQQRSSSNGVHDITSRGRSRPIQSPPPVPVKPNMTSFEPPQRISSSLTTNDNTNNVVSSSSAHNSNVFYGTASNRHQPHHLQIQDRIIMENQQQHHHLQDNTRDINRGRRAFTSLYSSGYSPDPSS